MASASDKPKRGFTGRRCDLTKLPKCGARAKSTGRPCLRPVERNPHTGRATRCRWHGGKSSGPKTAEGKKRVGEAARARQTKHGKWSKAYREARRQMRERLAAIKAKERDPK